MDGCTDSLTVIRRYVQAAQAFLLSDQTTEVDLCQYEGLSAPPILPLEFSSDVSPLLGLHDRTILAMWCVKADIIPLLMCE